VEEEGGSGGGQDRRPGAEPLAAGGGEAHPASAMPIPEPLSGNKKKGEAGGEDRRRRNWGPPVGGRSTPSRRWTDGSLPVLQARPPDGGNAVLEPLRKAGRGGFRSSTPSPSTARGGA
jgi:hypothetical protein